MLIPIERDFYFDPTRPPCLGPLVTTTKPRWDFRTCDTIAYFDANFGAREGPWLSKGRNHQNYNWGCNAKGICRQLDDEPTWAIDVPDLPSLLAFLLTIRSLRISIEVSNPPDDTITIRLE